MTRRQADLALLLATALWGTSFVAVKSALADATPFAFLTVRFGLAALALAPGTRFRPRPAGRELDRKSTRLNSSHVKNSYAVFCLKKQKVHARAEWETKKIRA